MDPTMMNITQKKGQEHKNKIFSKKMHIKMVQMECKEKEAKCPMVPTLKNKNLIFINLITSTNNKKDH